VKSFLEFLRERVNTKDWNLWFGTLRFDGVDEERKIVHLVVGNLFVREWIVRKYGRVIKRAVENYYGHGYDFVVDFENLGEDERKPGPLVRKKPLILSTLNPNFTFENFIVGEENRLIYSASLEVAENPGIYNPFIITGGVGLGKTHLMQAIGRRMMENNPDVKVLYITSETFMNEMLEALKDESMHRFREKLRKKLDVLLLDDVQFLMDKRWLQNELFHTINELMNMGKQIVICSDRNVKELRGFHERLISRFQMGLNLSIKPPSYETRRRIVMKFAGDHSVVLTNEMVDYIAKNITGNVRRLKGAILRLCVSQETDGTLNFQKMVDLISDLLDPLPRCGADVDLITKISRVLKVDPNLLTSGSRKRELNLLRMIGIYFCVRNLNIPVNEVAQLFKRSRTSILYTLNKVESMKNDFEVRSILSKLEEDFAGEIGGFAG